MVCHVLYCILLYYIDITKHGSEPSGFTQLALSSSPPHKLCFSTCHMYVLYVYGGFCCEFDQVREDPPIPLLQTIPFQIVSALGRVTVTL